MRIGYACLTIGVQNTRQRTCLQKDATKEKLIELINYNLTSLENIIDYNIKNHIKLFRISSDLIPFASSPVNTIKWWELFEGQLKTIGKKIIDNKMRVSMHPGQYTVLNSNDEGVVKRAILDLNYHTKVLDSLGVNSEHKIVLHIGGVYQDKKQAIERFIENYHKLSNMVKERLIIENDDKSYTVSDVLGIGKRNNIPVVFDNLHNTINPSSQAGMDIFWINECKDTWKEKDGFQKIHYSQKDEEKKRGAHSKSIKINEFLTFYEKLERNDLDIMLEVKDKNLSAIKCINCTSNRKLNKEIQIEWDRYKYMVLEKSQEIYLLISHLLTNKQECSTITFYNLIEDALHMENNAENSVNAALHILNYFEDQVSEKEKLKLQKDMERFKKGEVTIQVIKNSLWKLAIKYQQYYLLDSYYFIRS